MSATGKPIEDIVRALQERAKELHCLYRVDEILSRAATERDELLREVVRVIPAGWQFPQVCQAKLVLDARTYHTDGYAETPWSMSADIRLEGAKIGELTVSYTERRPPADEGPFLKEERRLLHAIVERVGLRGDAAAPAPRGPDARDGRGNRRSVAQVEPDPRVPAQHRPGAAAAHHAAHDQPPVRAGGLARRRRCCNASRRRQRGTARPRPTTIDRASAARRSTWPS